MKTQPTTLIKDEASSSNALTPLSLIVSLIVFLLHIELVHAEIESISEERLGLGDSQSYWEVDVTCAGESESITIRQQGGQSSWCTDSNPVETCENSKEGLADKICNTALLSILRSGSQQDTAGNTRTNNQAQAEQERVSQTQLDRQQQARLRREAETNRLVQEQIRLSQERKKLNQERKDIEGLDLDLTQQLKEIEEKLKQLE